MYITVGELGDIAVRVLANRKLSINKCMHDPDH